MTAGRMNPTKDSAMYPKPEYELQGWEIHALACGNTHTVVAADGSTIAWGSGTGFGELGLGNGGAKSSARPKKASQKKQLCVPSLMRKPSLCATHLLILLFLCSASFLKSSPK